MVKWVYALDIRYDGTTNWTQPGASGGLDPLGMLAPIEGLYTSLLQGLSSVTTRLRYYPFYCWWVTQFPKRTNNSKDSHFNRHIRDGEVIFAAISIALAEEEGWITGLGGGRKVRNAVRDDATINLDKLAPDYLINPVYFAAYRSQMVEMGLLKKGRNHALSVPTQLGADLANAFLNEVGIDSADRFLRVAEVGEVAPNDLADLSSFRCAYDASQANNEELNIIRRCLTGREGSGSRRNTCLLILKSLEERELISDYDLRFLWLETDPDPASTTYEEEKSWRHFQIADSIRVAMECLLSHATYRLSEAKEPLAVAQLAENLVADLPDDQSLEDYFIVLADTDQDGRSLQEKAIRSLEDDIEAPLALIAHLWFHYSDNLPGMAANIPQRGAFLTPAPLMERIDEIRTLPARMALEDFILKFVLRRHLDVASRKLRGQGNFTFQFEYEDGALSPQNRGQVGPASPRTKTLLTFLQEVGLISDAGITELGRQELIANQ